MLRFYIKVRINKSDMNRKRYFDKILKLFDIMFATLSISFEIEIKTSTFRKSKVLSIHTRNYLYMH